MVKIGSIREDILSSCNIGAIWGIKFLRNFHNHGIGTRTYWKGYIRMFINRVAHV